LLKLGDRSAYVKKLRCDRRDACPTFSKDAGRVAGVPF
jgi:hypothetical protein